MRAVVQMLWGERRGHSTFGAVQRLPRRLSSIDQPGSTAVARIKEKIAATIAPMYGTKRRTNANIPHSRALGTPSFLVNTDFGEFTESCISVLFILECFLQKVYRLINAELCGPRCVKCLSGKSRNARPLEQQTGAQRPERVNFCNP
jgi:hypothetical protein